MPESKWIANTTVKCDKCDWEEPIQWSEVKNWHNVVCPKCNDCIIVNDDDLEAANMLQTLSDIQDIIAPSEETVAMVRFDTAVLRK